MPATTTRLPATVPTPNVPSAQLLGCMWMLDHWLVFCRTGDTATPFVTWAMDNDGNCYWGHYHDTYNAASTEFMQRVGS